MREGWTYKKLGEVCEILNGFAFKSGKYTGQGIRVLRITNVQKGLIVDNDPKYYPFDEETNIKQYMLREGDLLMSLTGNVGRVGLLQRDLLPAALNQRVACLRIKNSNIQLEYIFHLLNSNCFERDCIFNAAGIAQKNMSTEWLKKYDIPIPSLSEQQSIVAELDKINELISLKKAQLSDLDSLAQSIFYDMFGDPIENEKGWDVHPMQEVCSKITDGTHDTPTRLTEGVKFITGKHIRPFYIDYDNSDYVTEEIHREIYARCNPEYDDVLYTNIGAGVANAAVNKVRYEFSMKNVALLKLNKVVLCSSYLVHYLNNSNVKNRIIESFSSGGAQIFLSLKAISKIVVPLPPLSLQKDFAKRIELIEQQKTQINSTIKDLETLLASRMQYWFD